MALSYGVGFHSRGLGLPACGLVADAPDGEKIAELAGAVLDFLANFSHEHRDGVLVHLGGLSPQMLVNAATRENLARALGQKGEDFELLGSERHQLAPQTHLNFPWDTRGAGTSRRAYNLSTVSAASWSPKRRIPEISQISQVGPRFALVSLAA